MAFDFDIAGAADTLMSNAGRSQPTYSKEEEAQMAKAYPTFKSNPNGKPPKPFFNKKA